MSKYKVGEQVYHSHVMILANFATILAVRERGLLKPIYLVKEKGLDMMEWTTEDKIDPIVKIKDLK